MGRDAVARHDIETGVNHTDSKVRIEIVVPTSTYENILSFVRHDVIPEHHIVLYVEQVGVLRTDLFDPVSSDRAAESTVEHVSK